MGPANSSVRNAHDERATRTNRRSGRPAGPHTISPTLWGVFFEDINLSADGGIYPELVRNRSFEDSDKPEFWKFTAANGQAEVDSTVPLNPANRHSLKITFDGEPVSISGSTFKYSFPGNSLTVLRLKTRS